MGGAYVSYMRTCGLAAVALVALEAVVNIAVDPYVAFSSLSLEALSPYRGGSKVHKAELLRRQKYDTLLLGTSRTEVGIDPASPAWGSATVFDASLPGTNMWQTQRVLAFAMSQGPPTRVVLFADFLMFNGRRTSDGEFARSRFDPQLTAAEYASGNLIGVQTLRSSWRVVARRASNMPAPTTGQGHRARRFGGEPTSQSADHRARFGDTLLRFRASSELYGGMEYPTDRLAMLRAMVASCQERGVSLTVVIPPVHALQLVMLERMGLWRGFEQWKTDLARIASGADGMTLWDFAYCHAAATEAVPNAHDANARMEWWIDSSHFRPRLGDVVLRRVMGQLAEGRATYGVQLTSADAPARLAEMRRSLTAYAASHPDEATWVGALR